MEGDKVRAGAFLEQFELGDGRALLNECGRDCELAEHVIDTDNRGTVQMATEVMT
jgi:hypothetical protein